MGILQRKGSSEGAALASCRLLKIRRGITVARFFEASPPERSVRISAFHCRPLNACHSVKPDSAGEESAVGGEYKKSRFLDSWNDKRERARNDEEEKARVGRASRPFRRSEAPPPRLSLHTPGHPEDDRHVDPGPQRALAGCRHSRISASVRV